MKAFDRITQLPKARANLCYYGSIPSLGIGALLFAVGRSYGNALVMLVGAALIGVFVGAAVFSLATSRCPHCRRYIDLRGPGAYCPKCGRWIPAREGDPPATLS